MCDKADALRNNPFAYLFPSLEEAKKYSLEAAAKGNNEKFKSEAKLRETEPSTSNFNKQEIVSTENLNKGSLEKKKKIAVLTKEERVSKIAESVFGITLNNDTEKPLVYLEEFTTDNKLIDIQNLEQLLFERLLLENPINNLLNTPSNGIIDNHIVQTEVITYLLESHIKLNKLAEIKKNYEIKNELQEMQNLILRNATTALSQPELYENQNLNSQILQIFYNNQSSSNEEIAFFFNGIVSELLKDEDENPNVVLSTFTPVFDFVHEKIAKSNMINFEHGVIFPFLQVMACNKYLAEALIDHSTPKTKNPGIVFSNTLLGAIFSLSCLPKTNDGPFEFFDSPNIHSNKTVEDTIWTSLGCICDNLHQLFLTLLKASPEIKHKTLQWFADCLHANAGRGKLSGIEHDSALDFSGPNVSDGFMLNISAVLLRLCQPFINAFESSKILKIDPTYCAVKISNKEEAQKRNCHMHNLHSETCLLPTEDEQERPVSDSFNFITECYFLAQKSIDLGFRICSEKVNALIEKLANIQRAYNDAVAVRGANHEVAEHIQERMQANMTKCLSIRTALIEPKTLDLLTKLHATSANWLIQILLNSENPNAGFMPTDMKPVVIPLPENIPTVLKCVPEFVLLNLTCFLSFIKRFNRRTFEENGFEWLYPVLSVIIVFMSSSKRISNPHLRAVLAESMEALLPNNDDDMSMNPNPLGTICRAQLFKQHPLSKLIIPSLLNVFVSIEMTGQSVEFHEKFKYRRPMYVIMDYLWSNEEQRECFKNLAVEAEQNMEAVTPPLFLRFLNLLINDAVFLLDEALSNMAQLKAMQAAQESGEWAKLPAAERAQNETLFQDAGVYAKFDNILGRWTIHTLKFLTSEITSIFWHPVLVDRVAAMLNYFLYNLVGPNKKNFKVKDKDEYDFKPDIFVLNICKIYVHLYKSDAFCLAVSQDGRSYNAELFRQAQDVLARIGGGSLIGELKAVDEKVSSIASRQKLEEELLPDAPEEFLDPIMSTVMTDPVILPSSRKIVDRTTIARHLLSDESDPFNRSPLTLDKVKSHEELRSKIQNWLKERKKQLQEQLSKSSLFPSDESEGTST